MDYDADGKLDFISGSYDPGDIYLFRGLGGGMYAKVEKILDKAGQPVVHHPKEFAEYTKMKDDPDADQDTLIRKRVASFGSWVAPVDWENDGDLDLLIGSFGGQLFRRVNEGTREKPIYGVESISVEADGEPFKVSAHANPVVADWNMDGKWDLVVSAGNGSVGWYENIGTLASPEFGPRQQLVAPAAESKFLEQRLAKGAEPRPGVRAQICVTDYNGDNRLDLIVGDYSDIHLLRDLDEQEEATFEKTIQKLDRLVARLLDMQKKGDMESAEYKQVIEDYTEATEQAEDYYEDSRRASFIWLYLRKS